MAPGLGLACAEPRGKFFIGAGLGLSLAAYSSLRSYRGNWICDLGLALPGEI